MVAAAASSHDWHVFDAERGLEVRQRTGDDEANEWEIRRLDGATVVLDDAAFDALRTGGNLPEALR